MTITKQIPAPPPSALSPNLFLTVECMVTAFYNLCEYYNLVDLARKTAPENLEFTWLKSLKKLSDEEGSIKAQEKIKEVIKDAVALQVSALEFLDDFSYLESKYVFDDAIAIEEESVEAFKVNYILDGQHYSLSIQFPTPWSIALNKELLLTSKIELMHQLIKSSLEQSNQLPASSSKLTSFFIELAKVDPKTSRCVCLSNINLSNLNTSNLAHLQAISKSLKNDSEIIRSFLSSPSFTSYEKSREIIPKIIQATQFSILKTPAFEQLAALEMQLLGERMKSKPKMA